VKVDGKTVVRITTGEDGLITVPVRNIPKGVHSLTVVMDSKGTVDLDWLEFE